MKTYQSILSLLMLMSLLLFVSSCEEDNISADVDGNGNLDAMLMTESQVIDEECTTIRFEDFQTGATVSQINVLGGTIGVEGVNAALPGQNAAMIFDSSNPTGGDPDLGTPNETFGGPGIGEGGEMGQPFENALPLAKVLIVTEDGDASDPDDEADGGQLFFDLSGIEGAYISSLKILDIEDIETGGGAFVRVYDENGVILEEDLLLATGNNGVEIIDLDYHPGGVLAEIEFLGSGALANLEICIFEEEDGCSRTLGYYKNHLDAWCDVSPNDPFFSSDLTYLEAIKASVKGDPYLNLAQQYIAAILNECNGAPTPAVVDDAIETAEDYLSSGIVGEDWEEVKDILDEYNNGILPGTISCDALEDNEEEDDD